MVIGIQTCSPQLPLTGATVKARESATSISISGIHVITALPSWSSGFSKGSPTPCTKREMGKLVNSTAVSPSLPIGISKQNE